MFNPDVEEIRDEMECKKVYLNKMFNKEKFKIKKDKKLTNKQKKVLIINEKIKRLLKIEEFLVNRLNRFYNTKGNEEEQYLDLGTTEVIIYLSIELNKSMMGVWMLKKDLLKIDEFKIRNLNYKFLEKN